MTDSIPAGVLRRREALRALARWPIAALLAAGGYWISRRPVASASEATRCRIARICAGCGLGRACPEPRTRAARLAAAGGR